MDIEHEVLKVQRYLKHKGINIRLKHVKGHQDRGTNEYTKMNIKADHIAPEGLNIRNIKQVIRLPTEHATITIPG
jgi:DNA polymerase I-like protein with 3'-5' exonuclease and polymerase domains